MIKCNKCKRVTKKNKPTGLIKEYRIWIDRNGTERKDISKVNIICLDCSPNLNKTKGVENE